MGIRFRCHHCEHELNLKEFQAGRRARCPVCSGRFRVPTASCDFSTPLEDDEQELAPAAARADQPMADQPGAGQPGAGQPGAGRSQASPPFELKQPTADLERFKRPQPDGPHAGTATSKPAASARSASVEPASKPARLSKKQASSKTATSKTKAAAQEVAEKAPALNAAAAGTAPSAGAQDPATQPATAQPAAAQPATAQPATAQPATAQPATAQPVAAQAATTQSFAAQSPQAAAGNQAAAAIPSPAGGPGLPRAIAEAPQAVWYVRPPSGGQFGPADSATFYQWMKENRVAREALVWRDGWPQWMNAGEAFEEYYGSRWLLPDGPAAAGQPAEPLLGDMPAGTAAPASAGLADRPVGAGVVEAAIVGGAVNPSGGDAAPAGALSTTAIGTPMGSPGVVRPLARRKRRKTNYTLWITVLAIVAIALVVVLVAVLMSQ